MAQAGRGDYAFALWLVGLVALFVSLAFWRTAGGWRHSLPFIASALVVASLLLRRRRHLVFGVIAAFTYLAYLAGEVFEDAAPFPIILAGLGLLLIVSTVWMQCRFPVLVERVGARRTPGRSGLPGSPVIPWTVVVWSLGMTLLRIPEAREERVNREFRERLSILRSHSGSSPLLPSNRRPAAAPVPDTTPLAIPPSKPPGPPPAR